MNLKKSYGKRCAAVVLSAAMVFSMMPADSVSAKTKSKVVKSLKVKNVDGKTLVLKKGKTFKLKVKVKGTGKVSKKVKFKSSNPKVVKVSKKGKLKALKKGKAKITITSVANKKKKIKLKVVVGTPVKKVVLGTKSYEGKKGDTFKLNAKVTPKKASVKKIKYTVSDEKIIKVDKKGTVTLLKEGKATVTATAKDGHGKKAVCKVTVTGAQKDENKEDEKTDENEYISYEGYDEKWKDEFEGDELNKDDWNVELHEPGWVNSELQEYVDSTDNIYVKDGVLHLVPIKTGEGDEATYTSGRVNTQGKHDFKYGMFEATLKVPKGQGYLPAFWMMPTDENLYGQWPKCGEIDCMEVMGQTTDLLYGTLHYGEPHAQSQGTYTITDGKDFNEEFHTYSVEWEPDHITWYVDGIKYHETNDWFSAVEDAGEITYPAPFDQNFYVILNLAIGGSWVGYPDETTSFENNDFEIDSVRILQKDAEYYEEKEANATKPEKVVIIREPDETGNYVVNGSFAQDINPEKDFELHLESDAANSTYKVDNGAITITPDSTGVQTYSIQLKQPGVPMYHGAEYTLTFDAKAAANRTMIVDIEGPDRNWKRYLADTTVDLTTTKQSYELKFTMDDKFDANGCLEFNLGSQGSTAAVTISNVSLKITGGEIIDDSKIKSVRADGNYVYNGHFQEGKDRLEFWEIEDKDKESISVTNTNNDRKLKVVAGNNVSSENPIIIKQSNVPLTEGDYYSEYVAYKEGATNSETDSLIVKLGDKVLGDTVTGELTQLTSKFTFAEEDDNTLYIIINAPGTYYVDDVVINEDALIKNGSFNAGKAGYTEGVYGEAKASAIIDSQKEDHAYDIDITDTGAADWNIQLMQDGILLEKDKWYKLTLKAKSNYERDILVTLQHNGSSDDNWDSYSGGDAARTMHLNGDNEWQDYECVFKMSADTDANSRLSITMGAVGSVRIQTLHRIFIDDIELVETDGVEIPDVEPGVNFFKNADFSDGFANWSETIANWDASVHANATRTINDGVIKYDIKDVGDEDWHVQLKQSGLALKAGYTYEVTFKIKSNVARTVKSLVMSQGYVGYGGIDAVLTANQETEIKYEVSVNQDDGDAFFCVSMGKIAGVDTPAGVIEISDFSIVKK